jgi:hypothetical protein
MSIRLALVVAAACLIASAALAADPDPKKAEQAVADKLKELKADDAKPVLVKDEAVGRAIPDRALFSVLFRLYPVALVPQAPLKSQNLFVVDGDGKVNLITDTSGLQDLFKRQGAPVKDDKSAKDAGLAWLRLTEELKQDGYYKFSTVDEATKVADEKGGKTVSVKAVVMDGGNGEIAVTLTFDKDGKLTETAEKAELKAGPRPRCHATKLLDPDPVVRAIVEQDLLIMGRSAKGYLDEQRAKASPELREAIDRRWLRILAGARA